ncbi:MAG: phosphatase PAP2 family protein [Prevotella sp.]|nr:phosphatase PAP2 family protein [Prevotella sp.]
MALDLFKIEKKPLKGLMAVEWVVMIYLVVTLVITLLFYGSMVNPNAMISGRIQIAVTTLLLWAVYRMYPSQLMRLIRICVQMALLSWWYPDTYELNRLLPNLDHVFASWEQALFGFQPALLFSAKISSPVFSELMDLGYASYYPLIALIVIFYFISRRTEFERCAFVIMASFFAYYIIFDLLPVVGPTFYYNAVGVDEIARGSFPAMGDYFNYHQECLTSPGYTDGVFYHLVEDAKDAGERPTAAFPSSHVGITTVLMWLAWQTRNRRLLYFMLPFFVLMFFATVYIQAHYAIDALAGLLTGTIFYFLFRFTGAKLKV